MDKNIAAILREDTRTCQICFELEADAPLGRAYTYVTHLSLAPGDLVVVPVASAGWKIGKVISVDEDLLIEPNCDIKFKWVIDRVDMEEYRANQERNKEIESMLAASYRVTARQAYAAQFLTNADPKVLALVKGGAQ